MADLNESKKLWSLCSVGSLAQELLLGEHGVLTWMGNGFLGCHLEGGNVTHDTIVTIEMLEVEGRRCWTSNPVGVFGLLDQLSHSTTHDCE